jgi:23S rRNA (guanosine2251-2'-O)-methyltransferase
VSRLVLGVNAVRAALTERPREVRKLYLKAGSEGGEIALLARRLGLRWQSLAVEQLTRLGQGEKHQGVIAELADFHYRGLEELFDGIPVGEPALLLFLDGIEDPHNLGAIVRSAMALGAHGLVIPQDRAAGVTPAVGRAAAGALESARIAQVVNLSRAIEAAKERGLWVAVADQAASQPVWQADLTGPLAIVVGAEGKGVRPLVRRHCDLALQIPILGAVGSLNASVAAGVLLYEAMRQRRAKGPAEKRRQ